MGAGDWGDVFTVKGERQGDLWVSRVMNRVCMALRYQAVVIISFNKLAVVSLKHHLSFIFLLLFYLFIFFF